MVNPRIPTDADDIGTVMAGGLGGMGTPPAGSDGAGGGGNGANANGGKPPANKQSGTGGGNGGGNGKPPTLKNPGIPPQAPPPPAITSNSGSSYVVYRQGTFMGVGTMEYYTSPPQQEGVGKEIINNCGSEGAGYAWICANVDITYYGSGGFDGSTGTYNGKDYRLRADISDYCSKYGSAASK